MSKVREITITLVKSWVGRPEKHRKILRALGLTKLNRKVTLPATPVIMGMVKKVSHLVEVTDGA